MAQPTPPVLPYDFSSELGTEFGLHLDANFDELVTSIDETIANLALIQRDDGAIRNQTVDSNAFTSDALALMAGSSVASTTVSWLPRGTWLTATLYNIGNIIETGSPATAYVCSVQHVSGVFATDYAAHKWVVLSTPRTLISADVTGALGFTPVNRAGDTMLGALTLTTGSKLAGASGATISDAYVAQDLVKLNKGLYVNYETSVADLAYGFAANVVRAAGDHITVGAQCSAIGAFAMTEGLFGSNFNTVGLNGFNGYMWGQEIDVGSFTPNNSKFKYGLNIIFFDRASGSANPGQYTYTFPGVGTYTNAGGGLGSNYYNKLAKAIVLESQQRSATGEWCGWTRGLFFGEYALDSEADAAYPGSRSYPIGIDFSELHYYGGTNPVTAFNLEAAIAMRDFQTIWWNRDPATASAAINKVKTYFNPATSRWVIENGGAEVFGIDVVASQIYLGGALLSTVSLAGVNVWSSLGSNSFFGPVTIASTLTFAGSGRRIKGEFSDATVTNRAMFQTSVANQSTEVGALPSGAGVSSAFFVLSSSTGNNCQVGRWAIDNTQFQIASGISGAAAYVPITLGTGGVERARISESAGQLLINTATDATGSANFKLRVNGLIQCDNPAAFSVHRNGTNFAVADATPTVIDWSTEVFDTNSSFDLGTDRFTPPPGKYLLTGACRSNGAATGILVTIVYKNGAQEKSGNFSEMSAGGVVGSGVHCIVDANGTDYFQLVVTQATGAPLTISGQASDTYFQGYKIG